MKELTGKMLDEVKIYLEDAIYLVFFPSVRHCAMSYKVAIVTSIL